VNRRLDDGEPGNRLVVWLNELPAVGEALAAVFRLFQERKGVKTEEKEAELGSIKVDQG
jgi:hypothetical protein